MGVFATITLGFSFLLGQPVEIVFSRMNPSAKNESFKVPPGFLISLMYSRFPDPFNLNTASTAKLAKCSLSYSNNLELKVVIAIFYKSCLNFSSSLELSQAASTKVF